MSRIKEFETDVVDSCIIDEWFVISHFVQIPSYCMILMCLNGIHTWRWKYLCSPRDTTDGFLVPMESFVRDTTWEFDRFLARM